jgi:RNA polymerase sigma-70 factor (ECF subfamily)
METHGLFLELFLKNQSALYAFLISRGIPESHADDVLQNIATVLWEKFGTFTPGTNFRAWAFSIAKIEILHYRDRWQAESRTLRLDEQTLERLETLQVQEQDKIAEYRKEVLSKCLQKLDQQAQKLIQLRYGDSIPFEELANRMAMSNTAVRIRICRIRQWLRGCVTTSQRAMGVGL